VLEIVREKTDRPTHLLEKDVWVIWTLGAIFNSPVAADLTFKGGTSLSKAYEVIVRFSEDIDLTYDIRRLIRDLIGEDGPLPANRSQASKIRGERYARHWHDLAALGRSQYFASVIADRNVTAPVARHKSFFFIEKDRAGVTIDYERAVTGDLKIVPEGDALAALAEDYGKMITDDVMFGKALTFEQLIRVCREVETQANDATAI